jgi:chromosome segregation ATPase
VRSFCCSFAHFVLYSYRLKIGRQDEVNHLQETVERTQNEKRDVEAKASEQAETCRQLTQANNTLSAKTLRLAEEAANAPVTLRRQLDECQENLRMAEEEIQALQMSDNNQRIALMDELNSVQTENSNLRAQLRALKR